MNPHYKLYTAEVGKKSRYGLFSAPFRDLAESQGLAMRLTIRDIKSSYRGSFLGVLWIFITPLMNTLIWLMLNVSGVVRIAETPIPYPVYIFTGTMLWSVFTESLLSPINQTTSSKSILSKINFPKEALILSGIYKILFNTGIKLMLMFGTMLILGVYPDWHLLLFPFALFSLMFAGTALGMLAAPLGLLYGDVGRIIPMATQVLMYMSPVVYVMKGEGVLQKIMAINPLTPLLVNARNWLTGLQSEQIFYFIGVNMVLIPVFFAGWLFYRVSIPIIVERSGS
jgi:lipopolysaccharide transport system permease protein